MLLALLAAVAVIPAGQTFDCTPSHVWDGDSLWCEEGPRIRLSGIAARETDGTCSPGHPCPDATAAEAKAALVRVVGEPIGTSAHGHTLVRGPTMRCASTGGAGGNRTGAWCVSPRGGDLSCAMVHGGWAAKWDRYWRGHRCG